MMNGMPSLKILHVTKDLRANGTGITDMVVSLAIHQSRAGHQVRVLCRTSDTATTGFLGEAGVTVMQNVGSSKRRARVRLSRDEVLHIHTPRALLEFVTRHPLAFLRRSITTVHNPYDRAAIFMHTARRTVVLASAAVGKRRFRRNSTFIPNAIVVPILSGRKEATEEAEPLPLTSVLYLGGLSRRKGTDILIDAWVRVAASVPGATLHLVGNRDAPLFERQAAGTGVETSIHFHGFAPDIEPYLRSCAIFVLPSRREGFPLVILQARAQGAAIVASDVDGVADALEHGEAGRLVRAEDSAALANCIIELLQNDSARADLQRRARRGLNLYSPERVSSLYEDVYRSLKV